MTRAGGLFARVRSVASSSRVQHMVRYAAVTYVGIAGSLISAPILAQTLGADGRGVLAGIFVVLQVLGWVAFLGLPTGLALQVERRREISFWGVSVTGLIGIVAATCTFVAAPVLANEDPRITLGIRIVSVVLVFSGVGSIGEQISLMSGSVKIYNTMRASTLVFPSVAIIAMFFAGILTLSSAFAAMLLGQVVAAVVGSIVVIARFRDPGRGPIPWGFSLRVWISSLFDSVGGRGDQLALTALTTAPVVGVYAIAVTCSTAASGVAQALAMSSLTHFVKESREGETSAIGRLMVVSGAMTAAMGLAVLAVVHWFGTIIFGPDFASLPPIVATLVVAQVLQDVWKIRATHENANERAGSLAVASAVGLVAMALVIAVLAVNGSLTGFTMALAMCTMCAIRLVTHVLITARRS